MVEITYDVVTDFVTTKHTKQVDLAELLMVTKRVDQQYSTVPSFLSFI